MLIKSRIQKNLSIISVSELTNSEMNGDLPDKFILENNGRLRSSCIYRYTNVGAPIIIKEKYIGIHPQSKTWRKASSYTFSYSDKVSISLNIGYGYFSFGVSKNTNAGGWSIYCDGNRYSKVHMKASFRVQKYNVTKIDTYSGRVLGTFTDYTHTKASEYTYCVYR